MTKILFMAVSILFIIGGLMLTHYLKKKNLLPNRWLIGCSVFLIALIPTLMFPTMSEIIKQVIYGVSGLLAVVFFESNRLQVEKNRTTQNR
ncbi:hypothetical protein [Enterococcus caccae]|uniref:Uncharacterized protein n=1 Tax=Enterococcus caccae ATCC BAA-1240 TaxID=1158612 RepID=R3TZ72_9ENTE|nr:hypothetical protein [Enterococcus caccae]EOL46463.1 hypothetical protein UC7_01430 [Enterococcus caccae ATCC BAA-1240]EOT60832.1 hypothetical protein I580_01732 [Enterococcus caccae ATCC BAA-1240]OJG26158.1 hypothetical protein RU98_GL000660 [Enterococcus caccae]